MSGANRTTQFLFSETEALQIKLRVLTDEVIELMTAHLTKAAVSLYNGVW